MKLIAVFLLVLPQLVYASSESDALAIGNNCSLIAGKILMYGGQRHRMNRQETIKLYTSLTEHTGMNPYFVKIAVNESYDLTLKREDKTTPAKDIEMARKAAQLKCQIEYLTNSVD
ncbi:MAG: hypothetical protein AB2793_00145 [Candidatus Thiodiazotropha sp.]